MTKQERLQRLVALGHKLNEVIYHINRATELGRVKGMKALKIYRQDILAERRTLFAEAEKDLGR